MKAIQPCRTAIVLLALSWLTSATVLADIVVYASDGRGWRRVGTIDLGNDHANTAWFCEAGNCFRDQPSLCTGCHAQSPSLDKYTRREDYLHLTRYFLHIDARLVEGQETAFAGLKLLRKGGRLVLVDGRGGQQTFPSGAQLLKGKSGAPLAIIHRSSVPPP